jgi:hypothetical protein
VKGWPEANRNVNKDQNKLLGAFLWWSFVRLNTKNSFQMIKTIPFRFKRWASWGPKQIATKTNELVHRVKCFNPNFNFLFQCSKGGIRESKFQLSF